MAFLHKKKQSHYLCHCHSLCKFHHNILVTTTNIGHMQLDRHAFCCSLWTAVTVAIHIANKDTSGTRHIIGTAIQALPLQLVHCCVVKWTFPPPSH